jgi:excinuclease UvrABC ATPase subunit
MLYDMLGKGFLRARIDGPMKSLARKNNIDKNSKHDIDFLVDEIALHEFADDTKKCWERLAEAVELGLLKQKTWYVLYFLFQVKILEN